MRSEKPLPKFKYYNRMMEELKKTDIDLSTASAVRERINDGKQGITEAVRITDRKGNSCLLLFDEKGVALPEQK